MQFFYEFFFTRQIELIFTRQYCFITLWKGVFDDRIIFIRTQQHSDCRAVSHTVMRLSATLSLCCSSYFLYFLRYKTLFYHYPLSAKEAYIASNSIVNAVRSQLEKLYKIAKIGTVADKNTHSHKQVPSHLRDF